MALLGEENGRLRGSSVDLMVVRMPHNPRSLAALFEIKPSHLRINAR